MSQSQTAINAAATRWLADLLERWGGTDCQQRAEYVTRELIAQGLAPVPKPVPIRPATPPASRASIEAARRVVDDAVAASRARRTGGTTALAGQHTTEGEATR